MVQYMYVKNTSRFYFLTMNKISRLFKFNVLSFFFFVFVIIITKTLLSSLCML